MGSRLTAQRKKGPRILGSAVRFEDPTSAEQLGRHGWMQLARFQWLHATNGRKFIGVQAVTVWPGKPSGRDLVLGRRRLVTALRGQRDRVLEGAFEG